MTNTQKFAEREFDILTATHPDPQDRPILEEFREEILALCEKFGQSGQSGGSAPFTASAISQAVKKLCLQQPIAPITGEPQEWHEVSDGVFQNSRCSALFRDLNGKLHHLGSFSSEIEAALAYNEAAIRMHGEFACLNIIDSAETPKT